MRAADELTQDTAVPRRHGWLRALLGDRRVRWAIEAAVVALVVEFVLLPQFAGSSARIHQLFRLDSPWLVLAIGAEVASLCAFAAATRAMLPVASRPRFFRVLRIDMSTIALSHSVPGGSAAGTGLGFRLLNEAGVALPDAAFGKVCQGVASGVVLQLLLVSGLIAIIPGHHGSPLLTALACTGVLLLVVVATGVFLIRRGRDRLAAHLARVTGWLPFVADDLGHRFIVSTAQSIEALLADRRRLAAAVAGSAGNWLFDALALWASVRLYGHSLSYLSLIVPFGVASTLAWIPLTPGGLGFVEATLVPVFVGFGVPKTAALLGMLTWRLIAFWSPIPLGGIAYASLTAGRSRPAPDQAPQPEKRS